MRTMVVWKPSSVQEVNLARNNQPKTNIPTHVYPGQHVREFAGATRHSEEDVLFLDANQYTPLSNLSPREGDITILAAHSIGFPKELYEPLWDDLLAQSGQHGFRIRSIWIAEASNLGASGVLNEDTQGDEPSWFDYSRDMLHMTNVFREHMLQPIVGIGHSMGATALIQLAIMHPRLLASLVLFDPIMGISTPRDFATMFASNAVRPDLWGSRAEAEEHSRALFKNWDPRTFTLWLRYGLRDTPTLLYPKPGAVTLRTSKAQEGWMYGRSWLDPLPSNGDIATPRTRAKYPDQHDHIRASHPFYRGEDVHIWQDLPRLRPGVAYIFPSSGPMTDARSVDARVERTGIGAGGSGGVKEDRVTKNVMEDVGHLLPFEKPGQCAVIAAEWLAKDVKAWQERRELARKHRDDRSINMLALSEEWVRQAKLHHQKVQRSRQAKL
ncbi:hypothetical protein LTR91_012481 [Friedmanniomyces endolithicus]|uniref:Serine aminopeptidase S33 domain-containing protein n=2 Tax=Friedmanniomyces endolithicus TaxID=329885 RepID=A0AAN6KFB2_9PEZI|nr:hypothetical protein LTR35_004777 [Friedmanniomyces endolithicus]KAK0299242.1 hypothetical protein LTS00_002353 [Friedmanniomyces endolithicus]KAK0979835.1 hypothetical protein LTR91_012481 [Friedmanniomyces endolithicus]KAK1040123.1 hypothetical protein LTS16_010696 [Friedmanniomyces endolithicus]